MASSSTAAAERDLVLQLARAHQLQLHPAAAKLLLKFASRYDAADRGDVLSRLLEAAAQGGGSAGGGSQRNTTGGGTSSSSARVIDAARAEAAVATFSARSTTAEVAAYVVPSAPQLLVDEGRATVAVVAARRQTLAEARRAATQLVMLRERRLGAVTRARALEGQPVGSEQSVVGLLQPLRAPASGAAGAAAAASPTTTSSTNGAAAAVMMVTVEDPDAAVEVELSPAWLQAAGGVDLGLLVPFSVVVATGRWDGRTLRDARLRLPTPEPRARAETLLATRDYFAGPSTASGGTAPSPTAAVCVLGDVRLNVPSSIDALRRLLRTCEAAAASLDLAALTFVLCGPFAQPPPITDPSAASDEARADRADRAAAFRELAQVIASTAPAVAATATFVFVPGPGDPTACCGGYPLRPLNRAASKPLLAALPRAVGAADPCRLRVAGREVVVARHDFQRQLQRRAVVPASSSRPAFEHVAATVAAQGQVWPLSDDVSPLDAPRLGCFPLPHLLFLCDSTAHWEHTVEGCRVVNPGSFSTSATFAWLNVADDSLDFNQA